MMQLNDTEWFNRKYHGGEKPTLEDRADLLRSVDIDFTQRQLKDLRNSIRHGLGELKRNCNPGLAVIVYSLITTISMTNQVAGNEIDEYVLQYRIAIGRRCPELEQNFG